MHIILGRFEDCSKLLGLSASVFKPKIYEFTPIVVPLRYRRTLDHNLKQHFTVCLNVSVQNFMQIVTITGSSESVTKACSEILTIMQQESVSNNGGSEIFFLIELLIFMQKTTLTSERDFYV